MPLDIVSAQEEERTRTYQVKSPMYGGMFSARPEFPSIADSERELPFVLEGELVRVEDRNETPLIPERIRVLQPSPFRVVPQCRHFGACGGCHYQHMAQPEQVRTKSDLLKAMLLARNIVLPVTGIRTHAAKPWQYRNRARLRLQDRQAGYNKRKSNDFLPIRECPILSPLLWRTVEVLQKLQALWPAKSSEVELFANGTDEGMQLSLHLDANLNSIDRSAPAQFRRMCDAMQVEVPQFLGAGLLAQAAPDAQLSRRVQERQRVEVARWRSPGLEYRVGEHAYTVSRNAFFQVNRFLTETMIELVVGSRTGTLALDLFAGAGLFSVALTQSFAQVVAVEIGQPAAEDLRKALFACGPQYRAEQKTSFTFLREWNRQPHTAPDLIVMDPPRAGLGREVVQELLKIGATELAYVSCDPTTFVRDCAALVESRYTLEEVHLLDLFPQTFHLETIALFRRR